MTTRTPLIRRSFEHANRAPRWTPDCSSRAHHDALIEDAPLHAIVAEDDDDLRRLLRGWLWQRGFLVSEARDGHELSRCLAGYLVGGAAGIGVDVVISDVRMPGSTGMEALETLRERDATIPVILITAFGDQATRQEAERLGARMLSKPFSRERLLRHLDAVCP